MVSRTRLGRVFQNLALFVGAAAIIGYFYLQTYDGNYGLVAQKQFEQEIVNLTVERDALRTSRIEWEQRLELLRSDRLDPDLIEEIARRDLGFVKPNDFVLLNPAR
jgi:cell division protein FtsB